MTRHKRALLLLGAIALFGARLGAYDLWLPDEPRYAEIAEELRSMREGAAGLVLLHLNGEAYSQKPPLYFWLAAAAGAPRGRVDEWAARLPSAVAGVLAIAATAGLGARLLGPASGLLGGALLLTLFAFAFAARSAQLDVLLTLFETLALAAFARIDGEGRPARRDLAALHGSLGLAVLTKGPVGWLVPTLAIAAFLAWERRLGALRRAFPLWGFALAFGPALLWLFAASRLAPAGWLEAAVVDNVLGRFVAGTSHARPLYYEIEKLPGQLLPWAPLLLLVAWQAPRALAAPGSGPDRRRGWRFCLAWAVTTLLFFSLSASKRPRYVMTSFPAYALLMADALRAWLGGARRPLRALRFGVVAYAAAAIGFAVWVARSDALDDPQQSLRFAAAALALLTASGAAWLAIARRAASAERLLAVPIGTAWVALLVAYTVVVPRLDASRSPRAVAALAVALAREGEAIGVLGDEALGAAIAYYGGRRVASLETPISVRWFAAAGGRVLVLAEARLAEVEAATPLRVHDRVKLDDSWLLVAIVGEAVAEPAVELPQSLRRDRGHGRLQVVGGDEARRRDAQHAFAAREQGGRDAAPLAADHEERGAAQIDLPGGSRSHVLDGDGGPARGARGLQHEISRHPVDREEAFGVHRRAQRLAARGSVEGGVDEDPHRPRHLRGADRVAGVSGIGDAREQPRRPAASQHLAGRGRWIRTDESERVGGWIAAAHAAEIVGAGGAHRDAARAGAFGELARRRAGVAAHQEEAQRLAGPQRALDLVGARELAPAHGAARSRRFSAPTTASNDAATMLRCRPTPQRRFPSGPSIST